MCNHIMCNHMCNHFLCVVWLADFLGSLRLLRLHRRCVVSSIEVAPSNLENAFLNVVELACSIAAFLCLCPSCGLSVMMSPR